MSRTSTGRDTRRSGVRRATVLGLGLLALMVLTSCSQDSTADWERLGLPEPSTDRATHMADLWVGAWTAALIIGFFVWGLILWSAWHFRRRHDEELPTQVRYNLPIEVLYTIAPIIVVAVLFYFTVEKQNIITNDLENPDHEIAVTAQQWSWVFNYKNEEAVQDVVYDAGNAAAIPQVWLVEDESVTFTLHSPDVIHSFWVPTFLFKLDVIPGKDQSFSVTPTKSGQFQGRCAELCGFQHSRMLFTVNVVDRETFDAHLQDLEAAGQVGELRGGSESDTVEGLNTDAEAAE
ncbi:MAG: cytochrome c oxidase subunit II [Nocardioidaceae bacterium]